MESPVNPSGRYPCRSHQFNKTIDSNIKHPPMIKISETLCKLERLEQQILFFKASKTNL